ncbi:hypothetical protein [Demequina pelophila]|uniref:hypothetical protein n=1 Tax=Demequina pelophila TaxID=1638984 RepID=UPI000783221F|nr:hypothetical protein [Demequina pelophila]
MPMPRLRPVPAAGTVAARTVAARPAPATGAGAARPAAALAAGALATLAAAGLAACAAPDYPILAENAALAQPASLASGRWVEVTVESAVDRELRVEGGALTSPYFAPVAAVRLDQAVAPGGRARLWLPLGAAVCPAGGGAASVQLTLEDADQELLQTVTVDDAPLAQLHAEACGARAVTEVAAPAFGGSIDEGDGFVATTVTLTRVSGTEPVDLVGLVAADPLVAAASDLPARLEPADHAIERTVTLRPADCESTRIAQASGLTLTLTLQVEGGEAREVILRPTDALADAVGRMLDACTTA